MWNKFKQKRALKLGVFGKSTFQREMSKIKFQQAFDKHTEKMRNNMKLIEWMTPGNIILTAVWVVVTSVIIVWFLDVTQPMEIWNNLSAVTASIALL